MGGRLALPGVGGSPIALESLPLTRRAEVVSVKRARMAVILVATVLAGCATGAGPGLGRASPSLPEGHTRTPSPTPTSCFTAVFGKPCFTPAPSTPTATPGPIAYLQPTSMSFIDDSHGWVLGSACDAQGNCRPGVARTDDGGASWSLLPFPSQEDVGPGVTWPQGASIYFTSLDDGWLVDPLLETTDGGATWTMVTPTGAASVAGVVSFDGSVWAVSGCVACATTLWESSAPGSPFEPTASQPPHPNGTNASFTQAMVAGSHLILFGPTSGGEFAVSPDGRTWELADLPSACADSTDQLGASPAGTLLDVCAVEVGGGFAPKEAWASTDWGSHWTLLSRSTNWSPPSGDAPIGQIPAWGYPYDIAMPTSRDAWMAMGREDMYETHDGGVTWTASAVPGEFGGSAAGAGQVIFVDATHGWAFGAEGMYRTTDGTSWTQITVLGPLPGATPPPSS